MELYEYFLIIRKKQRVFFMTLGSVVFVALLWQGNQSERYGATLLLNISRSGAQMTNDYTYDGFYRLQADERFSDTVVRWIGSPRGAEDVLRDAGIETQSLTTNGLTNFFTAGRLSSQVIRVEYVVLTQVSAEKISGSMTKILNRYANELNLDAQDPSWFVIIGSEPVIRDARISFEKVFGGSIALGIFLGLFFSLFAHYWEKRKAGDKE